MTTILERARTGEALTDLDIIDAHAHLGPPRFPVAEWGPEGVVACADRVGVNELWVSHMGICSADYEAKNEEMARWVKAFPGRLRGYLTPPPWSAEAAGRQTERYLAEGFLGIKLHNNNGIPYDTPEYEPVWQIAHERRLPVLLHTWGEPEMFDYVQKLAARYSEATIIMGHGMQRRNPDRYERLARDHEHLYLDTCLSSSPRGRIEELVESIGPEKVLFGSDVAYLSLTQQLGKVALADIPDQAKRLILSRNARRILARVTS